MGQWSVSRLPLPVRGTEESHQQEIFSFTFGGRKRIRASLETVALAKAKGDFRHPVFDRGRHVGEWLKNCRIHPVPWWHSW